MLRYLATCLMITAALPIAGAARAQGPLNTPQHLNIVWLWIGEDEVITRCKPMHGTANVPDPCSLVPVGEHWREEMRGKPDQPLLPLFEEHPSAWDADFDGNPFSWFADEPYPDEARKEAAGGMVGYILQLGAAGEIESCRITQSSGIASLDSATCDVLGRKGKFIPGHTLAGKGIPSQIGGSVTWMDQGVIAWPRETDVRTTVLEIGEDGTLLACRAETIPTNADLASNLCQLSPSKTAAIMLKQSFASDHVFLTTQSALTFDSDKAPPDATKRSGEQLQNLLRERYTIRPDGTVAECKLLERRGRTGARCTHGPFAPDPDQTGVRYANAFYATSIRLAEPPVQK